MGTGNAFAHGKSFQSAHYIEIEGKKILFDCGPAILLAAQHAEVDLSDLEYAFISHLHGDHMSGIPFLLLSYKYVLEREKPLIIIGPRGLENQINQSIEKFVGNFSSTSYLNIANFSFEKSNVSTTMIEVNHQFTSRGTADTSPSCYLKNNVTNEQTIVYDRYLSGAGSTGSSGTDMRTSTPTKRETWYLYCKSDDTDDVQNNVTIYMKSMKDINNNTIEGFNNATKGIIGLSAGTTEILSYYNQYQIRRFSYVNRSFSPVRRL